MISHMITQTDTDFAATVHFSGSDIVHYATSSEGGQVIMPSCGTRIGRYALPWLITAEVTCRKCQKL